jgi:hypothetical protein
MYYNKADLQEIFGFLGDKMKKSLGKGGLPTVKVEMTVSYVNIKPQEVKR